MPVFLHLQRQERSMESNGKVGDFHSLGIAKLRQQELVPFTITNTGPKAMGGMLETFRQWKDIGPWREINDLDMKLIDGNVMFFIS